MTAKSAFFGILLAIVGTASAVAVFILIGRFLGPLPLSLTQTLSQKQSTFDVTGESEVAVVPDKAEITLGIDVRKNSISDAQQEANTIMAKIQEKLTGELGIQKGDIRTTNYSIYPEYDYTSPDRRVIGYTVNSSVKVSLTDFEKLNKAIDLATSAGANQVGGVQFTLSTEKEREAKQSAREQAITKAQENAKDLSSLAGMRLGKIVNIIEQPRYGSNTLYDMAVAREQGGGGMGGGPSTQIEPGSSLYRYTVTLSYETL